MKSLLLLLALVLSGCIKDPDYRSGFTNGFRNARGERVIETAPSRPTPTPANPLTQPVDPTGAPLGR